MSKFNARFDILPPVQRALWPSLAGATQLGMVLYGGTAIAMRLGHRLSIDFDFFSANDLPSRAVLDQAFPFLAEAQVLQAEKDTLTVLAKPSAGFATGVKLQFFGGISFGRVGTPQFSHDGAVEVASLEDLMSTKLKVVMQRIAVKDYRDIAAMIAAGAALEQGLADARQMYGPAFQPSEALKALTYFHGRDMDELPLHDREVLIHAVSRVRELPQAHILNRSLSSASRL